MGKLGFDNDKYLSMQSEHIRERISLFGGKLYLDGGVADSIPFRAAEKLGFDRVVVILTRDKSYVKKPMNPKPIDLWYKHYPTLAEQLQYLLSPLHSVHALVPPSFTSLLIL